MLAAKQAFADKMIRKYGGAGYLRRGATDRRCTAAILDWNPSQRGLRLEGSRRALISAIDPTTGVALATPPDHEQDQLVFGGAVYRLPLPDTGPRTDGVTVGYHEFEVTYDSSDA